MARSLRAFGDRMLQAMLPRAEARAAERCRMVGAQCWVNCRTGCQGCNYSGGPYCGCTTWVSSC
ncbi:hypothetical protein ABNF97_16425 [Plantactinospora sp. B6F1]|uniref:hypothetical protein n=1 Tax=Plantactinospora sp. B6F1 TaxID=3158971 RepID=UPI0032D8D726